MIIKGLSRSTERAAFRWKISPKRKEEKNGSTGRKRKSGGFFALSGRKLWNRLANIASHRNDDVMDGQFVGTIWQVRLGQRRCPSNMSATSLADSNLPSGYSYSWKESKLEEARANSLVHRGVPWAIAERSKGDTWCHPRNRLAAPRCPPNSIP